MYDRVIVGVDDSDDARAAARTAFELGAKWDVPVDVVHVLGRTVLDALRSSQDRERIRSERTELLDSIAEIATDRDLEPTTALLEGKPAAELTAYAEDRLGSVLVLGRQGRSAVSEKLLGGVTEKAIETARVPVLVEPGESENRIPIGRGPVLVPTDGSANAEAAYPYAGQLAADFDVPVQLLSVLDVQRAGGVFNAGGVESELIERLESEMRTELADAKETLAEAVPDREIETALRKRSDFKGVSGAILDYGHENEVGCIVMGSHGRSNVRRQLLGSVTSTVLRDVDVPVLVIPRSMETS